MLPASELAALQTEAARLCVTPCTISRVTRTQDAYGSPSEATAVVASVTCAVTRPSLRPLTTALERVVDYTQWDIRFPAATDVRVNDILTIGTDTLVVQSVGTPRTYVILLHVLASEVK